MELTEESLLAILIEFADTAVTGFGLISPADRMVGACVEVLGLTVGGTVE